MLKAPTKCLQVAIGLIVLFVLSACEAPLNLEGVAAQQEQAVLRFDMFQGLATHGQRIVAVSSTGAALVSDDLASSWKRFALPENPTLIDIAACPEVMTRSPTRNACERL